MGNNKIITYFASFNIKANFVLNECEYAYINFFDLMLESGDSVIFYSYYYKYYFKYFRYNLMHSNLKKQLHVLPIILILMLEQAY